MKNNLLFILYGVAIISFGITMFYIGEFVEALNATKPTTIIFQEPPKMLTITAYTLRPEETDNTPCETALGKSVDICEWSKTQQLCATRLYPLLSKLKVGDITCIVVDRPAVKNSNVIDLIMNDVNKALQFGKQILPVSVIH